MTDQPSAPSDPNDSVSGPRHKQRMRTDYRDLIEDLIEDGRQRGLFDDLAGRGRPLELDPDTGGNALANKLLKDNDLRPAWLNQRVEVVEKIDTLRADIARTWTRYSTAFAQAQSDSHRGPLTIGWDDACKGWESAIVALNKQIEGYNLKRPASQLELFKLRLADELKRVDAPRYLR